MPEKRCYVLVGPKGKFYGSALRAEDAWNITPTESWRAAQYYLMDHGIPWLIMRQIVDRLKSLGWRVKEGKVTW